MFTFLQTFQSLLATSQSHFLIHNLFPITFLYCLGYYIFFCSFYWKQCQIVCLWFPDVTFMGCWSFFVNKCSWVSLLCSLHSQFGLTWYCLELLWAIFVQFRELYIYRFTKLWNQVGLFQLLYKQHPTCVLVIFSIIFY